MLQVAAGADYTVCVTEGGLVLACGRNAEGQLGVAGAERRLVPTLVTGQLQGKTAVYVAAGDHHTLCITTNGSLFSWDGNTSGQLGVGDNCSSWVKLAGSWVKRDVPTLVTGMQGKQVMHVAAGASHTICSTADGSVFTWGNAVCGKLGLGDDESARMLPTLARGELQGKQVVQVAAGDHHSSCVAKDRLVYMWGNNDSGQLGQEVVDDIHLPMLVRALDANANVKSE